MPNNREVWAGFYVNTLPADSPLHHPGFIGMPWADIPGTHPAHFTEVQPHLPPQYLTIEAFHITNNTLVMRELAAAYVELPATVTQLDLSTMAGLEDGYTYQFRIQAMAPDITGTPVLEWSPVGNLPWSNSLLSGVQLMGPLHSPGHPNRANIPVGVDFPAFTFATQRLATPQNLRTVTVANDGIGGGAGPFTPTGHRALEWDAVPGAEAYIIYALLPGTNTVYRSQRHEGRPQTARPGQTPNVTPAVPITQFNIGHDSVVQSQDRFNFSANNWDGQSTTGAYPTHPVTGELAFHAMAASTRQSFDLPLPYREFDFRVVAVPPASSAYARSFRSEAYTTRPGARSLSAAQMGALVNDAIARGAGGRGFVQIETGTQTATQAGTAGVLFIPLSNQPAASYDYFDSGLDGFTNATFLARAAFEIQNHPAYIGPETVIFTT